MIYYLNDNKIDTGHLIQRYYETQILGCENKTSLGEILFLQYLGSVVSKLHKIVLPPKITP